MAEHKLLWWQETNQIPKIVPYIHAILLMLKNKSKSQKYFSQSFKILSPQFTIQIHFWNWWPLIGLYSTIRFFINKHSKTFFNFKHVSFNMKIMACPNLCITFKTFVESSLLQHQYINIQNIQGVLNCSWLLLGILLTTQESCSPIFKISLLLSASTLGGLAESQFTFTWCLDTSLDTIASLQLNLYLDSAKCLRFFISLLQKILAGSSWTLPKACCFLVLKLITCCLVAWTLSYCCDQYKR